MKLNRRSFMIGAGGLSLAAWSAPLLASDGVADYKLDIRAGRAELLEEGGPKTAIWGYDGIVPGPMLRGRRGQPMRVTVTNNIQQPTSCWTQSVPLQLLWSRKGLHHPGSPFFLT